METWLVIALALLVLVLVGKRARKAASDRKTEKKKSIASNVGTKSTPFHAVSLKAGHGACRAAMERQGQRYLSAEAPPLPLPGCTSVDCQCRYVHYADRRTRKDRRGDLPRGFGLTDETGEFEVDRRKLRDRRKDDD